MEVRRDVFQAIADPTRRDIIKMLSGQPMSLNAVAEKFPVSRPAISRHIRILTECGVVTVKQVGRERYCHTNPQTLKEVADWAEQYRSFWTLRLNALEKLAATKRRVKKSTYAKRKKR
jgi:DNA-binding transcriptional ArsR family regulator